mgnify:CR=1 FL=1|jgi:hypothetical protein
MLNNFKKLSYKTKCLRIGFYLRCASQRATQCDCVIVNYSGLNDYLFVVNQSQFAVDVLFYRIIVFFLLIILIFLFNLFVVEY